ncbi:MAG TPA: gamma-glutamylcyclotransferase [Acetobacteraceae bacterium]|nr:gamma-glutamylcyclotransferase [Acetobacteraceae bacterium]
MILFVYGTLLDPKALGYCAGQSIKAVAMKASLPGHRRVRLRHAPYPTLRRCNAGEVPGVTLRINAAMLAALIAYEGPRYRLARIMVRTSRGMRPAYCFFGDAATRVDWHHPDEKAMKLRSRAF